MMTCPSSSLLRKLLIAAGIIAVAVHSYSRVVDARDMIHEQRIWQGPCSARPPAPSLSSDLPSLSTNPFAWLINLIAHAHHLNEPFATCPRSTAAHLAADEPRLYAAACFPNTTLWHRNASEPCTACLSEPDMPAAYHRYTSECTVHSHILRRLPTACTDSATVGSTGLFRSSPDTDTSFDARTGAALTRADAAVGGGNPCAVPCRQASRAMEAESPFLAMAFRVLPDSARAGAIATKAYGEDVAAAMQAAIDARVATAPRHCTEGDLPALAGGATPPLADGAVCEAPGQGKAGLESDGAGSGTSMAEAANLADAALTQQLLELQRQANATRTPSFVVLLFDASPLWVLEEGLMPLAERLGQCDRSDTADQLAAVWRLHRFARHNAVALNTSPSTLSLLSGAAPPNGTVRARRIANENEARRGEHGQAAFDDVSALDLFACVPALRDTHYCSDFEQEKPAMRPGQRHEPLQSLLAETHMRAHANMWDSPIVDGGAAILIDAFARGEGLASYAPDHVTVGPFPNPQGYGDGGCIHPAIRRHVSSNRFCEDDSLLMAVELDFLRDFDEAYRHVPTFSYEILYDTHENWDAVKQALPAVTRRLERIAALVAPLKDVFVFISADHGPHNSHFADTPMHNHLGLWALTPHRFETDFPDAAANLAMATAHPSTHRDLYETMRDLTDLYQGKPLDRPLDAARSMVRPSFRDPRTCAAAKVPGVFCDWE